MLFLPFFLSSFPPRPTRAHYQTNAIQEELSVDEKKKKKSKAKSSRLTHTAILTPTLPMMCTGDPCGRVTQTKKKKEKTMDSLSAPHVARMLDYDWTIRALRVICIYQGLCFFFFWRSRWARTTIVANQPSFFHF